MANLKYFMNKIIQLRYELLKLLINTYNLVKCKNVIYFRYV